MTSLIIELSDEEKAALAAKAQAQGLSATVRGKIVAHDLEATEPRRPIWDVIAENMKRVPPEDLAALPKDGLSQMGIPN